MKKIFYKCDPEKNVYCTKESCFIYGGCCTHTDKEQCAFDCSLERKFEESPLGDLWEI